MTVKTGTINRGSKRVVSLTFDTQKEVDIFNTLIGYYPYKTMEKLREEFGNKFTNVTTQDVMSMVDSISSVLKEH